jgi:transposase
MTPTLTANSTRIDDIPLLIGTLIQMGVPELYDREVKDHGHHEGMSGGWLLAVWLTFILSQGDHAKSHVQEWVARHREVLEQLIQQPIAERDFNDDRLGSVLKRLGHRERWEAYETSLWRQQVSVYEVADESLEWVGVWMDSTTASGFHTIEETGLMQRGYSKDHRPDLAQVKLMTAVAQASGSLLASEVVAGNRADDPLYLPLSRRVRAMLNGKRLMFVGDSKMAALATRAEVAWHKDYYLTVLPNSGETQEQRAEWIAAAVKATAGKPEMSNSEFGRENKAKIKVDGRWREVRWTERVQLIYSETLAVQQQKQLEKRLSSAAEKLRQLTPEAGRGQRRFLEEAQLREAERRVLEQHDVVGLLRVTDRVEAREETHYVGRGRGGANRPTVTNISRRYYVADVQREKELVTRAKEQLGWRVQVTNAPVAVMSLSESVARYRQGWRGERHYHLLKDEPLGISPLYVRKDDQIIGLTNLLTLGVRVLTVIEAQLQRGLKARSEVIQGLYAGLPKQATEHPTAVAILKAIARMEITLNCISMDGNVSKYLAPLPSLLETILSCLRLPTALYTSLADNSVLTT